MGSSTHQKVLSASTNQIVDSILNPSSSETEKKTNSKLNLRAQKHSSSSEKNEKPVANFFSLADFRKISINPPKVSNNQHTCTCGGTCPNCQKEKNHNPMETSFHRSFEQVPVDQQLRRMKTFNSLPFIKEKNNFPSVSSEATALSQGPNARRLSQEKEIRVTHHKQPISARIPFADKTDSPRPLAGDRAYYEQPLKSPAFSMFDDDSANVEEGSLPLDTGFPLLQPAGVLQESEEGETIRLPDIINNSPEGLVFEDAISNNLTYNPSITQGGAMPRGFGITRAVTHSLSGISVTRRGNIFNVIATVDNPITYQVRVSQGRRNQLDISSDTDPDITNSNYGTVVSDLTPCSFPSTRAACNNMQGRKISGKPPRDNFWARDLTIRHERFHVDESVVHGRTGVTLAQNWLNNQTANSVAGVNSLLEQVPERVKNTLRAAMRMPDREVRAYADGIPAYRARANAIKRKGDANEYATGSSSTGLSRGAKVGIGIGGGVAVGAAIGSSGGASGALLGAGIGGLVGLIGGLLA